MLRTDHGAMIAFSQGLSRSPHWPLRERAFASSHPNCPLCSPEYWGKVGIQVHHVHAFHICVLLGRADLELDFRNMESLCETEAEKPAPNHHLIVGHLDDFQVNNEDLFTDILIYSGMTGDQIKAVPAFVSKIRNRPKPFGAWTLGERQRYRTLLDDTLPVDRALISAFFPSGLPAALVPLT